MDTANNYMSIISVIKNGGYLLLTLCVIGELMFYFSLPNVCGCIMSIFSWWIFTNLFLKRDVILSHPFSWMFYLSMVLYRYLPLIATFFDGKPITYGFENPYYTIFGEMLLFTVQSLAFYIVCYGKQNGFRTLQRLMAKMDLYTSFQSRTIWIMGAIGLLAMVFNLISGGAEYGDVGGKFLAPLSAMKNVPLIMLFPSLYKVSGNRPSKKILLLYLIFLEITSMAGNSREALVHPIGICIMLSFLSFLKTNTNCKKYIFTWKFPVFVFAFIGTVKVFNMASDAMIQNRNVRDEVSAIVLLQKQIDAMDNSAIEDKKTKMISYSEGWDETYVDNFLLNRYCNMRITDETLYYAMKLKGWDSYGNKQMRDMFLDRLLANFPTPVLKFMSINIDKSKMAFSEGDYVYSVANNAPLFIGYRVASHLALGIACFGLLYFPIQFVLLLLSFYLLDTLVYKKNGLFFSIAGLVVIFELVGRFRNANGCVGDAGYLMRGFWQFIFLNWITFTISKTISNIFKR